MSGQHKPASNASATRTTGKHRLAEVSLVMAVGICAALLALTGAAGAAPPVVVMGTATNPTYTTVDVEGTVNPEGEPGEWFFQVSSDGGASWERKNLAGQFGEPVEGTITELKAGATYKVRLAAYNYTEFVEVFSSELEFTTESLPAPTVTIDPVTTHTGTTAELSGSITANSPAGNPAAAEVKWHFECSPECATDNRGTVAAGQTEAVHATATGLQPNSGYTVTLVGENAGGPVTGGPVAFTTSLLGPEAVTLPTVAVGGGTGPKLFLRGSIDPKNAPTEYWFEYGTTTAYGHLAPAGGRADGGSGRGHVVFQEVDGLAPGTTYHYQLVAEGPGGPSLGGDLEVTTAPAAGQPSSRAYELVSSQLKNGGDIGVAFGTGMQAAPDGNSMVYASRVSFSGSASGSTFSSYRATRGTDGWTTQPLLPPAPSGIGGPTVFTAAASTDLSRLVITSNRGLSTEGLFVEPNDLLMLDASGTSNSMTVGQPPGANSPFFNGGSPDLSRVVFTDPAALTPDSPTTSPGPEEERGNLYGWSSAGLRLLDVLPDGTVPSQGAALGADSVRGFLDHAISTDASRVFFTVPDDGSGSCLTSDCARIYLREDAFGPAPSSVEITANAGGPDAPGSYPAVFSGASSDGTRAFFTSPAQLTPDATTGASRGGNDLYEYRLGRGLVDLTVDHGDANGAGVLGVMGVADDGASVYFVAAGQLDGRQGVAGQPNLYLHQEGKPIRFIATLSTQGDEGDYERYDQNWLLSSQVTPDGDHAVFVSGQGSLNPTGSGQKTVYEFDVDTGLTCVSCDPGGAAPSGPAVLSGLLHILMSNPTGTHESLQITDDGRRVFFDSPDALVTQDTNHRQDVYVYEDGAAHLISSGHDSDGSTFADATPDGDDVFFLTRERLSGEDVDTNTDLYDARIGGRSVPPRVVAPSCQAEECRGAPPTPGAAATSATTTFSGAGNVTSKSKAQKLKRALESCRSKRPKAKGGHAKAKRKKCEATARKRFGKAGRSK